MFNSLLLATDGSGYHRAMQQAFDLAAYHTATIHVLYVIDIVQSGPGIIGQSSPTSTRSRLHNEGREALEFISGVAEDRNITVVTETREGMPAGEICAYANEIAVDLLILSPQRRTEFSRLLHGSVTERTIRRAEQPVLTIQKKPVESKYVASERSKYSSTCQNNPCREHQFNDS
ncbi:universal stress protein [Haladaptatus sp. CMAA 1909]